MTDVVAPRDVADGLAGGAELTHLRIDALAVSRDAGVAVNHGRILDRNFAPEKRKAIKGLISAQKS